MYAKAANRTGMDESAIRDKVENARIKDPATVMTLLKNSVENLKKQAKTLLADIQESKKTVCLLERQLNNFMKEVDLD